MPRFKKCEDAVIHKVGAPTIAISNLVSLTSIALKPHVVSDNQQVQRFSEVHR